MSRKNKDTEPTQHRPLSKKAIISVGTLAVAAGSAIGLNIGAIIHDGGSDVPPADVRYNGPQGDTSSKIPPQETVPPPATLEPPAPAPSTVEPPHTTVPLP